MSSWPHHPNTWADVGQVRIEKVETGGPTQTGLTKQSNEQTKARGWNSSWQTELATLATRCPWPCPPLLASVAHCLSSPVSRWQPASKSLLSFHLKSTNKSLSCRCWMMSLLNKQNRGGTRLLMALARADTHSWVWGATGLVNLCRLRGVEGALPKSLEAETEE